MKVLAFGTFDALHIGHLKYLEQAKQIASKGQLYVIVSRDINAEKAKGRTLVHDENERLAIIQSLRFVDVALLGEKENIFDSVKKVNPDIVVLGYDQQPSNDILKEKFIKNDIKAKVVRANPYKETTKKSSKIRKTLKLID